jgi:HD-like signal output (HDOD) protein
MLRRWQFDNDFITVVRECRNWMRDPDPKTDYCDIVVLARLFANIETSSMAEYPAIDKLPAYSKLPLGRLGPQMSVRVLKEARACTDEIQQILQD